MSSLDKLLSILDLFSIEHHEISVSEVECQLDCSQTTAYRYLGSLTQAGFLSGYRGRYVLGPRSIELDYLIRQTDPLLAASGPVLERVSGEYGIDAQTLTLLNERVIVTSHFQQTPGTSVTYSRGQITPMFRGAGCKILVSEQSPSYQRRLYEQHRDEARLAGLGDEWEGFRKEMLKIKRTGYAVSHGELDDGSAAISMSIGHQSVDASSALVLVTTSPRFELFQEDKLARLLVVARDEIIGKLDITGQPRLERDN